MADRTREILGTSDHGIVELRKLLSEQIERIGAGEDLTGLVGDPSRNLCIRLPQGREKCGSGKAFLAESITMGHARYSPLLPEILNLLGSDPGG